jgi:protein-S-isoprenylcysteine O-methyltransferase Ste14
MSDEKDTGVTQLVRPPILYPVASTIGFVIHLFWPVEFVPQAVEPLGAVLMLAGAVLFPLSAREFQRAGTPVPARNPVTALVRSGPYRFSRNPIYVAFTLIQLGFAIWVNSVWVLVALVAVLALMNFSVIAREERYMEGRFGDEYRDYLRSVRRWI